MTRRPLPNVGWRLPVPPRSSELGRAAGRRRGDPTPGPLALPVPARWARAPPPASSWSPPAPTLVFPGPDASAIRPVPRANPTARRPARRPPPPPALTWPTPTRLPAALPLFPRPELEEDRAAHSNPPSGGDTSGPLGRVSPRAGPWLWAPTPTLHNRRHAQSKELS